MTWTLRAHGVSKLGAWLFLVSLLCACASILGIEERQQDSADNYPLEGYAGCSPGNCAGCLEVHQQECQLRTGCSNAAGDDNCAGCVCQNCLEPLVDCQLDQGCAAIWQCLRDTRCDLSERASSNCGDSCGNVIQANGGLTGHAFRAAAEIRTCAAAAACLNCLAPQVQQTTRSCTQANGCQDCPDCFDQCLCSGEKFGRCQELCGEQAPPAVCTVADDCAGCSNCFDACACGGDSYEHCVSACTTTGPDPDPDPLPTLGCTPDDACAGCTGCRAQCVCSGFGDQAACAAECAPPPPTDVCEEHSNGSSSSCGGCQSCIAQYTCSGTAMESALPACGEQTCNGQNFNACSCGELDDAACFSMSYGSCDSYGPCEACACQQCPGELGMCFETPGCEQTFDCMRSTSCQGSVCLARCRGSDYAPEAFAFAEALWACYKGARCSCSDEVPRVVDCPGPQGSVQCQGYVGTSITLGSGTGGTGTTTSIAIAACCPDSAVLALQTPGGTTTPDDKPCGLDIRGYYRNARACEPRAQSNPPRYGQLETCPDKTVPGAPYNGALLEGCCRGADHTCGYFDDITGLGCLSAGVFGDSIQLCASPD